MSKLYYTESGHSMPNLAEELITFRRARKVLTLPPTSSPATLYFVDRAHEGSDRPLRVSVNGTADAFSAFTSVIGTLARNGGDHSLVNGLCGVFSGAPVPTPSF